MFLLEIVLALFVLAAAIGLSAFPHLSIERPVRRPARAIQPDPISAAEKSQATLKSAVVTFQKHKYQSTFGDA
jgi:peptidoglycan/LPS O-acetylase OafA/YrhL